jgi:hypothetical protein
VTQGIASYLGTGSFAGPAGTITWGPGTGVVINGISGITDTPGVRSSTASKAFGHGGHKGKHFVPVRTPNLSFLIQPPDGNPDTTYDLYRQVEQAFAPCVDNEFPLLLFNNSRLVNCRPTRRAGNYDAVTPVGPPFGIIDVEFEASDPRIYDAVQLATTLNLLTATGGLTWPLHWPLSWGTSQGGPVNIVNNGNFESPWQATLYGPLTNPALERVSPSPDSLLLLNTTLGAGDHLDIDSLTGIITLNDTINLNTSLDITALWWMLVPGVNSIRLNAGGGTGYAVIKTRSAWV